MHYPSDRAVMELSAELSETLFTGELPVDSITAFAGYYKPGEEAQAHAVATYAASTASPFVGQNIVKRSVDLLPFTPLKQVFAAGQSPLGPSVRNAEHQVAGIAVSNHRSLTLAVQLAAPAAEQLSQADIDNYFAVRRPRLERSAQHLHKLIAAYPELLLEDLLQTDNPTSPNAIAVGVDFDHSTQRAKIAYPQLRRDIRQVRRLCEKALKPVNGHIAKDMGDGFNFGVPLEARDRLRPGRVAIVQARVNTLLGPALKDTGARWATQPGYISRQAGDNTSQAFFATNAAMTGRA